MQAITFMIQTKQYFLFLLKTWKTRDYRPLRFLGEYDCIRTRVAVRIGVYRTLLHCNAEKSVLPEREHVSRLNRPYDTWVFFLSFNNARIYRIRAVMYFFGGGGYHQFLNTDNFKRIGPMYVLVLSLLMPTVKLYFTSELQI